MGPRGLTPAATPRSGVRLTLQRHRMHPRLKGSTPDLVTSTYERLRELIVHGRLAPGTRIIESELAARLGVSRTPVRSALHRLQQEGFVLASDGGKNVRLSVAPLTREDAREVLDILGLLEGRATAWAAELPEGRRGPLAEELRRLNQELGRLLRSDAFDQEQVFQAHSLFHQAPLRWVSAPRLMALHAMIRPQAERYRRIYLASIASGSFAVELEEHRGIIEAVERGEPERAQLEVQRNWGHAADRLVHIIASVGERGQW